MTPNPRRGIAPAEAGFALIEVVVSALIAVVVTGGVISLLNVTGRAGAEERHRSQAYSVAQEDQARLRGMAIPSLNGFKETRVVTIGNTPYTVVSHGSFVNDKTAELSCSAGVGSADYVQIGSEVTWPSRNPARDTVLIESIVTPPTGSLDPTHGTLVVQAVNAQNTPISAVGIAGKGPATFSGSTDSTGCAIFPDIPEGNYTVTPTLSSDFINKDGEAPSSKTVGVVGNSTKTLTLPQYDREGKIEAKFVVRGYTGTTISSKADSLVYINNQMQVQEKTFPSPSGSEANPLIIPKLFPFASSSYSVFAGCTKNKPDAGEAMPGTLVPSGATAAVTVRLAPVYVNVWTGKNSSNKGEAFNGADVWVRDDSTCATSRRYTTNSLGQLPDPGFPWSQYDVCADNLTSSSGTGRRQRINDVSAKSLTSGSTLNFYLGSGTSTVSESGNCP